MEKGCLMFKDLCFTKDSYWKVVNISIRSVHVNMNVFFGGE